VVIPALLALALGALAHPMHTSVAELRYDPSNRQATITIRIYPDDLASAVPGAETAGADSALRRYVNERFTITDRHGTAIRLEWQGVEPVGDALRIRLRAAVPAGLAGARVAHLLLHERFGDQVNIVRAGGGGHTATLLFVPGDGAKRLP
jgi:hypothetical protein